MNGKLRIVAGSTLQREIAIPEAGLLFGRAGTVDVSVQHPSVSRRHCLVWSEYGQLLIRDLGSTNGTYINDERVSCSTLTAGDELQVGPVVFQYQNAANLTASDDGLTDLFASDQVDPHLSVLTEG